MRRGGCSHRGDRGAGPHKKSCWGALKDLWVPHDERDQVVDFVHRLAEKTEVPIVNFVEWLGIARAKFYGWRRRYGKMKRLKPSSTEHR